MIKTRLLVKKIFFLSTLLLCTVLHAQKSLNGVYAGQHMALLVNGSYMIVDVILFRPDGTFNDNLKRQDWRAFVAGKYHIAGKKIQLQYSNGKENSMEFDENGNVLSGGFSLLKLNTFDVIPKGMYKHQSASGSGGNGSMYVGVFHNADIYIDGKGNFRSDKASSTVVSGSNVGGGANASANGSGRYTIDNGVLMLKYNDGHEEKHSFFCNTTEKPVMATIDGDIYFLDQDEHRPAIEATHKQTSAEAGSFHELPDVTTILGSAKQQAGGSRLDSVGTLKITAHTGNITMVSYMDFTGSRKALVEIRSGGKLISTEILTGDQGWSIVNGHRQSLAPERITEMKQAFFAGPFALRSDNMAQMQNTSVRQMNDSLLGLDYTMNGTAHLMLLTRSHRIVGEGYRINGKQQTSNYSDFKYTSGIDFPTTEILNLGGRKINIHYDAFDINVPLPIK